MGRRARTFAIIIGAAVGIVAILAALAAWRLSAGPVAVDVLAPVLEQRLAALVPGSRPIIEGVEIAWDADDRTLALRAREVSLAGADGAVVARFPAVDLGISLAQLRQGRLALRSIELKAPRISLARGTDGRLALLSPRAGPPVDAAAALGDLARQVETMLDRSDPSDPVSRLEEVRITDGGVEVADESLGIGWRAADLDLSLRRSPDGVTGELSGAIELAPDVARFRSTLGYRASARTLEASLGFSGVRPSEAARLVSPAHGLANLDRPLEGTLAAKVDLAEKAFAAELAARAGPQGPEFGLAVRGAAEGGDLVVLGTASLGKLELADAAAWWPIGFAAGGRIWVVENITAGTVDALRVDFTLTAPAGDLAAAAVDEVHGSLAYHGLQVHFLRPLPPVTGLAGTGTIETGAVGFAAGDGRLGAIQVGAESIRVFGLDGDDHRIAIELSLQGPLAEALGLLDHPRLDLASRFGITPDRAGGEFAGRLDAAFPLLADLQLADLALGFKGRVVDAAIREALPKLDVRDGRLNIDVDAKGLRLAGELTLASIPVTLDWRQDFAADSPRPLTARAVAPVVDAAGRAALGLDLAPHVEGPASVTAEVVLGRGGRGEARIDIDLEGSALAIPAAGWRKQPGVAGRAGLTLAIDGSRVRSIESLRIEAGALAAQGSATLADDGRRIMGLELSRLRLGETDLRDVSVKTDDAGLEVTIAGGVLDARPLARDREPAAAVEAADASAATPPLDEESLTVSAGRLDRVIFGDGRWLENVRARLRRASGAWTLVEVDADVPPAGGLGATTTAALRYGPPAGARVPLTLEAADAGSLLWALDAHDHARGGRLSVTGHGEGRGVPAIEASVAARSLVLTRDSGLGRVFADASVSGLFGWTGARDVALDRVEARIRWSGDTVSVGSAIAYNPSLGITGDGVVDLGKDTIEWKGTIVPAYSLNRLLGRIPVLGSLFTDGGGVLAVSFEASGPLDDPEVKVLPLESVTPGVLGRFKSLFFGGD